MNNEQNPRIDRAIDATIKFFNERIADVYMKSAPERIILKADKTIEYQFTKATTELLNELNKQKLEYVKTHFPKFILYEKNAQRKNQPERSDRLD